MPGAFIMGCDGPDLGATEAAFFRAADPLGFILFRRNVETPEQLRRLTDDLRAAVGRNAPVLIDQEGGQVARLRPPHWRGWPTPRAQVQAAMEQVGVGVGAQTDPHANSRSDDAGTRANRALWLRYRLIAAELYAGGIDVNCAPVADVAGAATHPFLRDRCYGDTPGAVTNAARAVADGLLAGGVLPVVKHMPGHGRAQADTHLDLPRVDAAAPDLKAHDFAPFRALADLPMGMTAHIVYPAFDGALPATLSPAMIRVIRDDIGFQGLLMTDDIGMGALAGPVPARGSASLAAGCDVVLHCNGDLAEREAMAAACGTMTPQAMARTDAALARRRPPEPVDIAALEVELERLCSGRI
jgi:beta-N-acetylhexosaminidase